MKRTFLILILVGSLALSGCTEGQSQPNLETQTQTSACSLENLKAGKPVTLLSFSAKPSKYVSVESFPISINYQITEPGGLSGLIKIKRSSTARDHIITPQFSMYGSATRDLGYSGDFSLDSSSADTDEVEIEVVFVPLAVAEITPGSNSISTSISFADWEIYESDTDQSSPVSFSSIGLPEETSSTCVF